MMKLQHKKAGRPTGLHAVFRNHSSEVLVTSITGLFLSERRGDRSRIPITDSKPGIEIEFSRYSFGIIDLLNSVRRPL